MNRFKDKVVAVTGAGQGVGFEVAKQFAEEGAKVIVIGRTLSKLENTVNIIGAENAVAYAMDVGIEEDWKKLVEFIKEKYGKLDVLINNAGIIMSKDILTMTYDEFKENERINLDSVFLGMKYSYEVLAKNSTSAIVNVSSIGGIKAGPDSGNDAGYNATKAGVRNITKHASYVFAKDSIRVNSVHPGGINTDMMKKYLELYPELRESLALTSPLPPHYAEPEDVAAAILFLASPQAKAITGTELIVDNGMLAI